jgi:type II secretory pathway pseudopilin PulG
VDRRLLFSFGALLGLVLIVALAQFAGIGFEQRMRRRRPEYLRQVAQVWIDAIQTYRAETGSYPEDPARAGVQLDREWKYERWSPDSCALRWDNDLTPNVVMWSSSSGWSRSSSD